MSSETKRPVGIIGPQKAWEIYQAALTRAPNSQESRDAYARYRAVCAGKTTY